MAKKQNKDSAFEALSENTALLLKSARMEYAQNCKDLEDLRERTHQLAATQEQLIVAVANSLTSKAGKKAVKIVDEFWKELQALQLKDIKESNKLYEVIKACREQIRSASQKNTPKS